MLKLKSSYARIDSAALLLLFTLFTAACVMTVMAGANQYKMMTEVTKAHYENRNVGSYLREKIRQNNASSAISVTNIEGVQALAMTSSIDNKKYITYIYYQEGWLYELLVTDTATYDLAAGEPIIEVSDFMIKEEKSGLLRIDYRDSTQKKQVLYINLLATEKEGES